MWDGGPCFSNKPFHVSHCGDTAAVLCCNIFLSASNVFFLYTLASFVANSFFFFFFSLAGPEFDILVCYVTDVQCDEVSNSVKTITPIEFQV